MHTNASGNAVLSTSSRARSPVSVSPGVPSVRSSVKAVATISTNRYAATIPRYPRTETCRTRCGLLPLTMGALLRSGGHARGEAAAGRPSRCKARPTCRSGEIRALYDLTRDRWGAAIFPRRRPSREPDPRCPFPPPPLTALAVSVPPRRSTSRCRLGRGHPRRHRQGLVPAGRADDRRRPPGLDRRRRDSRSRGRPHGSGGQARHPHVCSDRHARP